MLKTAEKAKDPNAEHTWAGWIPRARRSPIVAPKAVATRLERFRYRLNECPRVGGTQVPPVVVKTKRSLNAGVDEKCFLRVCLGGGVSSAETKRVC